ncbi:RING finger domain-containing protein [Candidatus Babela massiliensis]|uniref:Ring finger protein n=1 Tax=Candidatus Babela massiliensis TaxID=673862 RepID=V6DHC5_9BACT|nr:RING finger domain-containing protein [Candidatus Babela massiliensis]CDK30353.1 ring finger protein [Candidatus Babela massiliensis]
MINNRLLTGLLSISLITHTVICSNLNDTQAKNYIQNLIDTLFLPNNHSGKYERDLKNFANNVTRKILNRIGKYENYYSFSKVYNSDRIYQELINESIDFIEKSSIDCAKDEIGKFYVSNRFNERDIINSISKKIRREIYDLVNKSTFLDQGIFTNYYGVQLVNKVHELIAKEIRVSVKPTTTYSTPDCPICFEDFQDNSIKRVFLKCGHNLCNLCLKNWSKQKGSKTTCPICRAIVNINDFINEL